MAVEEADQQATDNESDQIVPDWVYLIPGLLLVTVGFGGIIVLAVT